MNTMIEPADTTPTTGLFRRFCDVSGIDAEEEQIRIDRRMHYRTNEMTYQLGQRALSEARAEAVRQKRMRMYRTNEKPYRSEQAMTEIRKQLLEANAKIAALNRRLSDLEDALPVAAVEAAKAIWEDRGQ